MSRKIMWLRWGRHFAVGFCIAAATDDFPTSLVWSFVVGVLMVAVDWITDNETADRISDARRDMAMADFKYKLEHINLRAAIERLREIDREWVAMETAVADEVAYWESPEGQALIDEMVLRIKRGEP